MTGPARSKNVGFPIRDFIYIPSTDTLEAFSALINDLNRYFAPFAMGIPITSSTFAALPLSATEGAEIFVTDGRKVGEVAVGTGVWAYWSNGHWRVLSTDAPVSASAGGGAFIQESGGYILQEDGSKILLE